ncbi:MAG: DRTGG domain-containing protein [Acutalibacteraceae bacterium]|nr:DRTGG domain-containing protein [Acutalibacteraceae bacterium]
MTVAELKEKLVLRSAYSNMNLSKNINGCYIGDYLSVVMKNAKPNNIWITVVNNQNTVGVAMLKGLSCIIMCDNIKPTAEAVKEAVDKNIPILISDKSAYQLAVEINRVI